MNTQTLEPQTDEAIQPDAPAFVAEPEYEWNATEMRLQFKPHLGGCYTLDQVAQRLREEYPGWLVYSGGSHVALHRRHGSERLLLIVEKN